MFKNISYAGVFVTAVLLQIFLLDNISLGGYFHPLVYSVFIILLPLDTRPVWVVLSSALLGVVMDVMTGTDGLNVIAATAAGFFRPMVIGATCGRTVGPDDALPALYRLTAKNLAWYIGAMVVLHSAIFFFMETLSLRHLPHVLLRLAVSGTAAIRAGMVFRAALCREDSKQVVIGGLLWLTTTYMLGRRILRAIVLGIFAVLALRIGYIQLVDTKYKRLAAGNVLRYEVQYAPRGEVVDRNGEYLVQSKECYDLMVVYRDIGREGFDTTRFCNIVGIERKKLESVLRNARMRPRAPTLVLNYVPKEVKLRFEECNFPGFYTVYRTVRQYPRKIGGNLLGYVGEVNDDYIKRNPEYSPGDYVGMTGVEAAYEPELRGKDGVKILEVDTHGAIKGSYMDGAFDSLPVPGKRLMCTIDARRRPLPRS